MPAPVILTAAGMGDRAIRISDEAERLLRITAWMRECLEGEMSEGMGTSGKHGVDEKTLRKWKELVNSFNSLVDCKVRLDKTAKSLADAMSPAEELEAIRSYVRALPPKDRAKFLDSEAQWHSLNQ